jgi:hypothetical protein
MNLVSLFNHLNKIGNPKLNGEPCNWFWDEHDEEDDAICIATATDKITVLATDKIKKQQDSIIITLGSKDFVVS